MNKKTFLLILVTFTFCMMLFSFALGAYAEPLSLEGEGTLNDPYIIYDAEGLIAFATKPNFSVAYAQLANDIDLEGKTFNGFDTSFEGSFEGNGYAISNLTLNGGKRNLGLFAEVLPEGNIHNLTLNASVITSLNQNKSLGILAGKFEGKASGIHTFGEISGKNAVGGIIGQMNGGTLFASSSSVNVEGSSSGGLVGELTGGNISHCYSFGSVTTEYAGGGVVGDIQGGVLEYVFSRSTLDKADPEDEYSYIGHIAGISMVETLDNLFYFEIVGNLTTNVIGAFGNNYDTSDMLDSATLVSDIEAKTSFVTTLNDSQPLWAYGQLVEGGYPTLRSKYSYAILNMQPASYVYSKGNNPQVQLDSPDYQGSFSVYYTGSTFNGVVYPLSATPPCNAGNYTIYAKPNSGTVIGVLVANYTIEKADLTAEYFLSDKLNSTYTGLTQTLEILDELGQVPNWAALELEEPSYLYYRIVEGAKIPVSKIEAKDVGRYEVVATIEGGNNYNNLQGEDALVATLEITKATLYMKADDKVITYGDSVPTFTVSLLGFVAEEYPSIVRDFVAPTAKYADSIIPTNAGEYPHTILLDQYGYAHNYTFLPLPNADPSDTSPEGSGSMRIQKADLWGIGFSAKTVVFNTLSHTIRISGAMPENTSVLYALDEEIPSWQNTVEITDAGTYRILAKIDAGANYNTLLLSADLIIQQADITGLVFEDLTTQYDGTAKTIALDTLFDHTITYVKEGISSFDPPISVGNYIVFADIDGGNNYKDIRLEASLIIQKLYVRIVANNALSVYGEDLVTTFSLNYYDKSGVKMTAVPSSLGAKAVCSPQDNAGEYEISVTVEDTNNFEVVITKGIYTIQKADLIVGVNRLKVPYNSEIPAFTLVYSGFVKEQNASVLLSAPVVTTTAKQGDDAGEYYVSLQGGEAQNYSLILVSGNFLVIERTERTGIVFNGQSVVYDSLPKQIVPNIEDDYSVTYNGLSDLPVNVGSYYAELSLSETKNYYSYSATAILKIEKAKVLLMANSPSAIYGENYKDISIQYIFENVEESQSLLSQIDASFACEVNAQNAASLSVNVYPITLNFAQNANFNITAMDSSYSISKALLTFTVVSRSFKYNEIVNSPSVTVQGFVREDSLESLTAQPVLSALPQKGDNVGNYPVYLSGGVSDNYSFKYIHGSISITRATLANVYMLKDKCAIYDGLTKSVALEWADGREEEVTYLPSFEVSGGVVTKIDAGVYPVSISIEDREGNYEYITFSAMLTIVPRTLTVRGTTAIDRIYNGSTKVNLIGGILYDEEAIFDKPNVALQLGEGTLLDKNVGLSKTVVTNVLLTGNAARNYSVVQPTMTVDIYAKQLTILGVSAVSRNYNGDSKVNLVVPDNSFVGLVVGDEVLPDKVNSYGVVDKNAGIGKAVTTHILLYGKDSANYELIQPDYVVVDISAASIFDAPSVYESDSWQRVIEEGFGGIYDRQTSSIQYSQPVYTYSGEEFTLPLITDIQLEGVSWVFNNTAFVGAGIYQGSITVLCLSGNFLNETITFTWEIAKREVNILSLLATDKVYDSNNTATLKAVVTDILAEDEVTLDVTSAIFDGKTVGNHNATFVFSLTGRDANNYYLGQAEYLSTEKATLAVREITITDVVALSRDYNGDTLIELQGGTLTNTVDTLGFLLGSGQASSASQGEVDVTTTIVLIGEASSNYVLIQPTLVTTITPKTIYVVANNFTMYANNDQPELTYTVEGLIGEDTVVGTLTANTKGRKAGKYAITLGTLTADNNYNIQFTEGILTIKTPTYVWVLVGVFSGLLVAGAAIAIVVFVKKGKKAPSLEQTREIED